MWVALGIKRLKYGTWKKIMICFHVHLISQLIGILNGHEDSVRYISKLEDGNIISASCHKTIEIWNVD